MTSPRDIRHAERGIQDGDRLRRRMIFRGEVDGHPLWTKAEVETLKRLYPTGYQSVLKELRRRTYFSVRGKAEGLGIRTKRHVWTGTDVSKLRRLFPKASTRELLDAFPGVSINAIIHVAQRFKIRRLRTGFTPTGIAIIDQIRDRAFHLGYSMVDLDDLAHSGVFFQRAGWHGTKGPPNPKIVADAVRALDGELVIRWRDE